jgi:chitin synthase
VHALQVLLHSFGYAKTAATSSASKYTSYLELHFHQSTGRLAGAKALPFALDKSRILARLRHEERTFHVFYQLLAGAGMEERESLGMEDASEYSMLAASGTFRLPGGSNGIRGLFGSDDSVAYEELKDAFRTLGFKPKSVSAIWAYLVAILTLGSVKFLESWSDGKHAGGLRKDEEDGNAVVANPQTLEKAARMLGVDPGELENALTRRTDYARKEIVTMVLDAKGAERQRDRICADLYAMLFAFVVESANRKTVPATPDGQVDGAGTNQIVFLDQPGYQTRAVMGGGSVSSTGGGQGPLIAGALGQNGFDEFVANYQDELVHSFVLRQEFEEGVGRNSRIAADGVALPAVNIMDNRGCVELLRGDVVEGREVLSRRPGGLIGMMGKAARDLRHGKVLPGPALDDELTRALGKAFGASPSFVQNPQQGYGNPFTDASASSKDMFGVNHWAGNVAYDAKDFVERDCDGMDAVFVRTLRRSDDPFVSKLFSGPGLCTEAHAKDRNIVVRAQVSVRPLREPTPFGGAPEGVDEVLEKDKAYAVTSQVDSTLATLLARLERADVNVWTVACIRPNDSGSPNSFDKRRVRHQVRALGLVDLVVKRAVEWAGDWSLAEFFEKTGHDGSRGSADDVREWAREVGWGEGVDYTLGKERVWVSWDCWKDVEDRARAAEGPTPVHEEYEESSYPDDATTTEGWGRASMHGFGDGGEALYQTGGQPTTPGYGSQLATPMMMDQRGRSMAGGQGESWGRGGGDSGPPSPATPRPQEGTLPGAPGGNGYMNLGSATNLPASKGRAPKPVEVVPTTATRRWWVIFVWLCTWWIPSFLLSWIGGMKRADVRMAWREKVTIVFLILTLCGMVIFYVIWFGKLICPEFNNAWSLDELKAHTADNDFWVAVQGKAYDITSFWKGDHGTAQVPVTQDVMKDLAGKDISAYFPPPIGVACAGLGTNNRMEMRYANATSTPAYPQAVHYSSQLSTWTGTELSRDDWYNSIFLKKMSEFYKGPIVWDSKEISSAVDDDKKYVFPSRLPILFYALTPVAQGSRDLQQRLIRPLRLPPDSY